MGTNPDIYKMPNRNLGRKMGKEDGEEKNKDENVQEIASDTYSGNEGLGTNFSHERKSKPADK